MILKLDEGAGPLMELDFGVQGDDGLGAHHRIIYNTTVVRNWVSFAWTPKEQTPCMSSHTHSHTHNTHTQFSKAYASHANYQVFGHGDPKGSEPVLIVCGMMHST